MTPGKSTKSNLPALVGRTKQRQLSVCLSESDAEALEQFRARLALKSWGQAVRALIAFEADARHVREALEDAHRFARLPTADSDAKRIIRRLLMTVAVRTEGRL